MNGKFPKVFVSDKANREFLVALEYRLHHSGGYELMRHVLETMAGVVNSYDDSSISFILKLKL